MGSCQASWACLMRIISGRRRSSSVYRTTCDLTGSAANDDRLSPKLVHDLTAFRTTALQERLAGEPEIALVAVLHAYAVS